MSAVKDMTGCKFGNLKVLSRAGSSSSGKALWLCECSCGKTVIVLGSQLRSGATKSCGCLVSKRVTERNLSHGKSKTRLYHTFSHMKDRCYNKNDKRYAQYGGRGIRICEEWLRDFNSFYDWAMSNGYKEGLSIDRINVDGNYEPLNCRWVTMKVQQNNRSNNHVLEYGGETHTLSEWGDIVGIQPLTILQRIRKGWSAERALCQPVRSAL